MNQVEQFIESGILEMYVLGQATDEEIKEVEQMKALYNEVGDEIEQISIALEGYAKTFAAAPDPFTGPFLMAKIDYMERLKGGEAPTYPAILNPNSKISDYSQWLNRPDLQLSEPLDEVQIRIIGNTPEAVSAIVWLKNGAPAEVHDDEFEQFLILEGTCDITIDENEVHHMQPGGVLIIPLYKSHTVRVTSEIPCKILLQRVAA